MQREVHTTLTILLSYNSKSLWCGKDNSDDALLDIAQANIDAIIEQIYDATGLIVTGTEMQVVNVPERGNCI